VWGARRDSGLAKVGDTSMWETDREDLPRKQHVGRKRGGPKRMEKSYRRKGKGGRGRTQREKEKAKEEGKRSNNRQKKGKGTG